jgi:hypothetical protein
MFLEARRRIVKVMAGLSFVLLVTPAFAQQVGEIDLTQKSATETPRPISKSPGTDKSKCDHDTFMIADGEIVEKGEKPKLTLVLVSLNKNSFSLGETIEVQLILQNSGENPVRLAWSTQPPKQTTDHEVSRFTVWVAERPLDAEVSLWGSEDVPGSLLKVSPGEWVRIRFAAKVECAKCAPFQPSDSDMVDVSWWQYLGRIERKGCDVKSSAFKRYKARSNELKVTITSP